MSRRPSTLTRLIISLALALQAILPVLPVAPPALALAAEAAPTPAAATPAVDFLPSAAATAEAELPFVLLALAVTPANAAPGAEVTLQWQLTSRELAPLAGLMLTLRLPEAMALAPGRLPADWDYDARQRLARYSLPELAAEAVVRGAFTARVVRLRAGDTTEVAAELLTADGRAVMQAAATLLGDSPAPQITVLDAAGGTVGLEDGRVTLTLAPGAVAAAVTVYARLLGRPADAPGNVLRAYEFVVRDAAGQELHTFPQPLTLTVRYPAGEPAGGRLFVRDDATATWQALPTTWDAAQGALVATVPHLSQTGEGNNFVPEVMPSIRGWQTDLFSGAASYDYPVSVPPGRGGLTPGVALGFSSRSRYEDGGHAAVTGAGWKLTADSFIYGTPFSAGSPPPTWRIDGAAYSEAGNGSTGWYLKEAPTWRIVKPNGDNGALDAYAPDGTRYHFEPALHDWWCDAQPHAFPPTYTWRQRTDKWVLQSVSDPLGNHIDYTYDTAAPVDPTQVQANPSAYGGQVQSGGRVRQVQVVSACPTGSTHTATLNYLAQINLTRISYNSGQSRIDFTYAVTRTDAALSDPADSTSWAHYTTRLLTGVTVAQGGSLTAAYKLEYDFFADGDNGAPPVPVGTPDWGRADRRRFVLRALRRCSDAALTNCLPATHLTNSKSQTLALANGYGGQVALGYGADGVVATRTVTDTVTGTADQWGYAYTTKLYDGPTLAGYRFVTETLPSSLGSGNWVAHQFLDNSGGAGQLGKEAQQVTVVSGVTQAETLNSWVTSPTGVYGGAPFTYLSQRTQRAYDKDGANPQDQVTQYFYDSDHQQGSEGAKQYGNLTRIKAYSDGGSTLYRTTERWYYPKVDTPTGKYIVNRLGQEKLWDAGNVCQGQTRWIYDTTGYNQQGAATTQNSQGLLKEIWQAKTCDGASQGDWVRQTLNGYDSYGNLNSATAANNAVTSTSYDTSFGTYPLSVTTTPGAGGGATLTTSYAYYGINPESGGYGLVGQLQKVVDPNAATTRYRYDGFGRALELRKPGTGSFSAAPSEMWLYADTASPTQVQHRVRADTGLASDPPGATVTYLEDYTFYDGLGQPLQTQAEVENSGQSAVVSRQSNALGAVIGVTAPYTGTTLGTYQVFNWITPPQPVTRTAYDGLGRVTKITQPDNSTVETVYHGRRTAVLDPLGRQTLSVADAFGRLSSSQQFTGTYAKNPPTPGWNDPPYATATYAYNVRDQLETVTGPDGAVTDPSYDLLGRKTQLIDADMGTWTYDYDAVGNLIRQTDAKNQRSCFYYDGHNRLKGKTYTVSTTACPADPGVTGYSIKNYYDDTTYTYTEGGAAITNRGLGRRTRMEDPSGSTQWVYDGRGRLRKETQTITGAGTFVTQWNYGVLDAPVAQIYPGGNAGQSGEQVDFGYSSQGLLDTVSGAATYVGDTLYNVRGQVTERRLGSTAGVLRQLYAYSTAENFRLVSLKAGKTSPNYYDLQRLSYTYDDNGNVLTISDAAAYGGSQTQSFSYDDLNRLKTAQAAGGSYGTYSSRNYAYSNAGNLTSFEGSAYAYNDAAHKHAVTHIGGVQKYWYDADGNATRRITPWGLDITLAYDAENRLTQVSNGVTASYTYDGDGNRVKAVVNGTTSIYVGNYYEVTGGTVKKYYYAGNVRVAENNGGTQHFLLSDHLGSTAITTDASGNRVTELRYYPYGDSRYNPGGQITTYRFTGQRWDSGTALYFYGARWYDPTIGRFLSADTLVPSPDDPQSLNRYSYVLNNPTIYVDPSGHAQACADGDAGGGCGRGANTAEIFDLFAKYGKYKWFAQAYASIYEANVAEAQGDVYATDVRASSDAYLQQARNFLPQHDWRGDALLLVDANSAYQVGSTLTAGGAKVIGAWVGGIANKQNGTLLLQAPSGSAPWKDGASLKSTVVGPEGMAVYRAHGEGRAKGAWVSPQPIPSQQYARESLAVKPEWNPATYASEIWLPPGTRIQTGIAGAQGSGHPGGAAQIQILNAVDIANSVVIRTWQLPR